MKEQNIIAAYFSSLIGTEAVTNININSKTTDKLYFTDGSPINITATQLNFGPSDGNQTGSTISSVTLIANSNTNSANNTYQIYFNILENNYTYTQGTSVPEIILSVSDPTGSAVTSINGLTYVTVSDTLKGFDITNKTGIYTVASDYAISTSSSTTGTTQNWTATITYRNLDTDQEPNEGAVLNAKLLLQKEST